MTDEPEEQHRAEAAKYRIVTPGQLSWGYRVLRGAIIAREEFEIIRRRDDGNYVVKEPVAP